MTYQETFIKELKEDYGFAFDCAELDDALQEKFNAAQNKYYELQDRSDAMLKKIKKDFHGDYDLVATMIEDNAAETWIDNGGTDEISEIVRNAFIWHIIALSYDTAASLHSDL